MQKITRTAFRNRGARAGADGFDSREIGNADSACPGIIPEASKKRSPCHPLFLQRPEDGAHGGLRCLDTCVRDEFSIDEAELFHQAQKIPDGDRASDSIGPSIDAARGSLLSPLL